MTTNRRYIPELSARGATIALAAVYLALVVPLVATGAAGTSEAADQNSYHLPIVRTMVDQWPRVDVVHYDSATAPGYHLALATAWRLSGARWTVFALNVAATLGLLVVVLRLAQRFAPPAMALALVLPLTLNPYLLGGAVWLTTDNAALLFVVLVLGGVVSSAYTPARCLRFGLYGALAVFVRQIHVWVAAPIGLFGLLASPAVAWAPGAVRRVFDSKAGTEQRWSALVVGALSAAMPVALLAVFVWLWGGLIPRASGDPLLHASGANPATPALALALCGVFGVFFLATSDRPLALLRGQWAAPLIVALLGLAVALAVPTSFLEKPRAYGWFWHAVRLMPAVLDRSTLIAVAAPVGALALFVLYRGASRAGRGREATVLLLSMLAWVVAQSANAMAWQRYFDPMILIGLAWLASLGWAPGRRVTVRAVAGPLALAAVQAILSAMTLYREAIGDLLSR